MAVLLAATALFAAACGTASASEPLPEGWQRVQVRQGLVGREFENPLAGFTIDLPPGWRAGESWPSTDGPAGWIAGTPPSDGDNVPVLHFDIGGQFGHSQDALAADPAYDVSHITVDGEPAFLHLAAPDAIDDGPQVGIYYERIPVSPPGAPSPSLRIEGDSRGFTDQELLARVLKSVRYAEITTLPDLPELGVMPGAEWERIPARTDFPSFTIMTPPGWVPNDLRGIDTLVGEISGGGITVTYDFGGFAGVPFDPLSAVREHQHEPPHLMWEERIGDRLFWFVRPASPDPDPAAVTGVFAFLARSTPGSGAPTVSVHAYGLSGDQQETVLAMLRTLEHEPD